MAQSPMVSLSPCVELPIRGDGCTVPTATSYLTYMLPLQGLDHLGTIIAPEERERDGGGKRKEGRGRGGRRRRDGKGGRNRERQGEEEREKEMYREGGKARHQKVREEEVLKQYPIVVSLPQCSYTYSPSSLVVCMSQLPILPVTPGEHLAVSGERHGMPPP